MSESARPDEVDTARIHLHMRGERRQFEVPLPTGRRKPLDLLPTARELTHQATAIVLGEAQARGESVSCRAGCGACCCQLVTVSPIEALALFDLVESLPPERQAVVRARFAQSLHRLEAARLLDPNAPPGRPLIGTPGGIGREYWNVQTPCPFLEDQSCSIHPDRPLVCREYHVTSPAERCKRLYVEKVRSVMPPLHMNTVLAQAANRIAGVPARTIPLVLILEIVPLLRAALEAEHDGTEMFTTMLGVIDQQVRQPFEQRDGMSEPDASR
jgi:Fe-S-cluster containining protein